jgi:hypothetical protein
MSVGKFLAHIWDAIKHLFDGLPAEFKAAIDIGVTVTEKVKTFIDNPEVDVFTAIIPGTIDDAIVAKLRDALPKILIELKLAQNCAQLTDPTEIVKCAILELQSIEGDFKSAFLHDLSILIAQVAADGKLDWKDGAAVLEWYYQHKKEQLRAT